MLRVPRATCSSLVTEIGTAPSGSAGGALRDGCQVDRLYTDRSDRVLNPKTLRSGSSDLLWRDA